MKTNREECLDMWDWVRKQPDGTTKEDWASEFPEKAVRLDEDNLCFACKEDSMFKDFCKSCPVTWNDDDVLCGNDKSPFEIWIYNKTSQNADKVYQTIKATWKE